VTHGDDQPDGRGEGGELGLEDPGPVTVGPAGIGGDHQRGGVRIAGASHPFPPPGDQCHRERGGVVVVADVDPSLVGPAEPAGGSRISAVPLDEATQPR
jgi:hypothetical protein